VARFAIKPTSSILIPRRTVDRYGRETEILNHRPPRSVRRHPRGARSARPWWRAWSQIIIYARVGRSATIRRGRFRRRRGDGAAAERHCERIDMLELIRIIAGLENQVTVGNDDGGS
jgi:chorismate synthase